MVAVAMVVLAGCQAWPSARFDAANTGFNAKENQLGAANVSALAARFTADVGSVDADGIPPVVVNGSVYVSAHGQLQVYSATGGGGCAGTPVVCVPLWTADLGGRRVISAPTVSAGTVFVSAYASPPGGGESDLLFAFDAAGREGCGGTPVTCTPKWTAAAGFATSPTVYGGVVYVATQQRVAAIDAAGVQGCAGVPKVCTPLWTTAPLQPNYLSFGGFAAPTVGAAGLFMIDYDGHVYAYDQTGHTNCGGVPVVCAPTWTASTSPVQVMANRFLGWTGPVLDGSRVLTYTAASVNGTVRARLSAFDAAGVQGCAGVPVVCIPEWTTTVAGEPMNAQLAVAYGSVFVAYRPSPMTSDGDGIAAFATDGSTCTGLPMTCDPQWTSTFQEPVSGQFADPIVANGLLYQPSATGVSVFDAHGASCTAPPTGGPPTCGAVAHVPAPAGTSSLSIVDGRMYIVAPSASGPGHGALAVYQ